MVATHGEKLHKT